MLGFVEINSFSSFVSYIYRSDCLGQYDIKMTTYLLNQSQLAILVGTLDVPLWTMAETINCMANPRVRYEVMHIVVRV